MLAIEALHWAEVDPTRNPFSEDDIAHALAAVEPALWHPRPKHPFRIPLERAIDHVLISNIGLWTSGWRWRAQHGGLLDVRLPSMIAGDENAKKRAVIDAVQRLRQRLTELASEFAVWGRELEGHAVEERAAIFATRLVNPVVEWTQTRESWYETYQRLLAWGLESIGTPPTSALTGDARF